MSQRGPRPTRFPTISEPAAWRIDSGELTVDRVVAYLEERQKSVNAVREGRPFSQTATARAEVLETTLNWIEMQRGRRR